VLCLDEHGEPVRDAIVWLDKRKATGLKPLPTKTKTILKVSGLLSTVESLRSESAGNWIVKNEPEVWAKTHKFVLLSAYFNHKFTGNLVDSIANTVGSLPFDYKKKAWIRTEEKRITRCLFDVEDEKMIDLVEPGTVIGEITEKAAQESGIPAGLPYVVTGSDKACELLALGALDEESAALSFGTTATIDVTSEKYFEPISVLPAYPAITGGYNPEVETFRGYWLISWFKNEFAHKEVVQAEAEGVSAEEILNRRLSEIPAGCGGLVLQPSFTPDEITPHAKGAVIGFSDIHTRIHFYRAIIEGINFSLIEGLKKIEKKGKRSVKKLYLAGGGASSSEICQITANMFGLPAYRIQSSEASGIGSSLVAFVSLGVYPDYKVAVEHMRHIQDEFIPDMEENKTYVELYDKIYCNIFGSLAPLYKELTGILKKQK
jgi:sugar (pentulose or hexulose) kinase